MSTAELDEIAVENIVHLYNVGAPVREIAAAHGVNFRAIYDVLGRDGINLRRPASSTPKHWRTEPATLAARRGNVDWMDEAACSGLDVEIFYPAAVAEGGDARRVCRHCPVRNECLSYALECHEDHGIWGGATARERHRMARSA